jgi:ERCC4-type nuclease
MLSITIGFGIPIIPTNNPTETANIIVQQVRRMGKTSSPIQVKTHKKGQTISEMRQQIFCCFPGIGPKLAKALDEMPYPLIQILGAIDTCQIDKLGPKKREAIREVLNKC